ncbi:uncharacterized protein LOC141702485 isoform X2 [Apium graveolens]|uniref:uncharacterized protein LOC141702485 isoform X2 n=1 Tax=Apium graveolens TaxID=4045 RepID=UPI003D79CAD8
MCLGFLLMEQGHASSSTPSVSSSSVGMISIKCAENVSKSSDLDCVIVSQEGVLAAENTQNQENPAKRKKPLKSEVWNHFDRFEIDTKAQSGKAFEEGASKACDFNSHDLDNE